MLNVFEIKQELCRSLLLNQVYFFFPLLDKKSSSRSIRSLQNLSGPSPATLTGYKQLNYPGDVLLPILTCPALWPHDTKVTNRREFQVERLESFVRTFVRIDVKHLP